MLLDILRIPPIAPDEDILAWIYAIADENGWDHQSFVSAFFPGWYPPYRDDHYNTKIRHYYTRNYTKYYEMYNHLGFPSPQDMLMEHTSIPVSGLFAMPEWAGLLAEVILNGSDVEIEPVNRPGQYYRETDICEHPPFLYCPLCVKEDMEKYGRPIAHIPHQAMSHTASPVCYKHMVPLSTYEELRFAGTEPLSASGANLNKVVEILYREHAVGDITDIVESYRQQFNKNAYAYEMDLHDAVRFTPEELLELYDKDEKRIDMAIKAAEVMGGYCADVKHMGYSPFPFLRYRCVGRRGESISYILSLTSGMTCRLCGKCKEPETISLF